MLWEWISTTFAYTESTTNTFAQYQKNLVWMREDIEAEFRKNGSISVNTLQNAKALIQNAYDRLPDSSWDDAVANATVKKWVDLNIDLAIKNPTSQTYVSNAASAIERFSSEAKIQKISGSITANPTTGNAPLSVSFLASSVVDPSGVTPPKNNYIWWVRDNGGYRREIGRWPILNYPFIQEWSYQVFLDVISGSRNSRGYTDILPLSISQVIEVKPRLWEVVLLVNGVNASSLTTLKISPTIGKMGIILDATASRAIANGIIKKSKWDFWNGNVHENNGSPVIERQLYVNPGSYDITLEMETNEWASFKKNLQLNIIDPSAVISVDRTTGFVGDEFQMRATTYLSNTRNVEYTWTVQSANSSDNHPLTSTIGQSFNYIFPKVGDYFVTLISKSPNGLEDRDSKTISIESHEPVVNLENPRAVSNEKPNTFVFDASRSLDPDTKSSKNLTYIWSIDGNEWALDSPQKDGSIGKHVFTTKWPHMVSVNVINSYGKSKSVEKMFDVISTLSVNMNIVPRAAPIGTLVSFQAIAPRASFFEWNPGDGSPSVNGQMDNISHIYKKTGIYTATLSVKNTDGSESNSLERKIYVTDTNNPYALIEVNNTSNTVLEDSIACGDSWAFLINRSESTTIDGSNSINIDGDTSGLTYTWKYLDHIKTGPTLSEKFTELGCFPIELTVKSNLNGSSHTSKRFLQIKNIPPRITSLSTKVDQNKKDSQKILVNVTADGARDDDGVITSYIWYYKTESDNEPQNIKITQNPSTTFVIPNITEKYTFWVIIEDNDGARVNSQDVLRDQSPLLISNDNGNINIPLITLLTPKSQVLAGETVNFVVSAKTILGTDITSKSDYQWDFNGDGKIDRKTSEARTSYTYMNSWNYAAKVKVTYNGSSNTKYQNIIVKNELKANVHGYRTPNTIYLINTSSGIYDSAFWQMGDIQSDALYSLSIPSTSFSGNISKHILTVNAGWTETSTRDINLSDIEDIATTFSGWIYVQSFPQREWTEIHATTRGEKILLSLFGNTDGTQFSIDTNTRIDSDTNGTPDDDADNKDYPSYTDGSVFAFDTTDMKLHDQKMRLSVLKNGLSIGHQDIDIIADFIPNAWDTPVPDISWTGWEKFSEKDKENLGNFQTKIRTLASDERITLMQEYSSLIENWDDIFERTKKLIDMQEEIVLSSGITDVQKKELSSIIDNILVGNANATDEVTIATQVIESLIPMNNPNRAKIIEKLESIKSHPSSLQDNKVLGKEILGLIEFDTSIEDKYKPIIKAQLQTILSGGQASVPTPVISWEISSWSGIWAFISGTVKVFGMIILVILCIILIGFILYRFSRKNTDMGFQDFLIDSIFHSKSPKPSTPQKATVISTTTLPENFLVKEDPLGTLKDNTPSISIDPMASFTNQPEVSTAIIPPQSPSQESASSNLVWEESASIPDWLKPQNERTTPEMNETLNPLTDILREIPIEEVSLEKLPEKTEKIELPIQSDNLQPNPLSTEEDANIPDWLKGIDDESEILSTPPVAVETLILDSPITDEVRQEVADPLPLWAQAIKSSDIPLPDWLVDSVSTVETEKTKIWTKKKSTIKKKKVSIKTDWALAEEKKDEPSTSWAADLPDWLK